MRFVIYQQGVDLGKFMEFAEQISDWKIAVIPSAERQGKFPLSSEIRKIEMYPALGLCQVYLKDPCQQKMAC